MPEFSYTGDCEDRRRRLERGFGHLVVAGIGALTLALLLFEHASVPGLHGDEAWAILRARQIAAGYRPLSGMNEYSGALFEYLISVVIAFRPQAISAGRTVSVVLNLVALAAITALARWRHPSGSISKWTMLLTGTSIPFVTLSRFGIEVTALTPSLYFGGLWLATRANCSSRARWPMGIGAGLLLSLTIYNHGVSIAVIAATLVGFTVSFGRRLISAPASGPMAVGFLAGLAPTVAQFWRAGGSAVASHGSPLLAPATWRDLVHVPSVLAGCLDGDLLFQRFCGQNLLIVRPFFSVTLVLATAGCLYRWQSKNLSRIDLACLSTWLLTCCFACLISPGLAPRYLMIPLLCAPYLLARSIHATLANEPGATGRTRPALRSALLGAIACLQLFYLASNYFVAFGRSGGTASVFPIGERLLETSSHFLATRLLHQQLLARGVRTVVGNDLIVWPLEVHDLSDHKLRFLSTSGEPLVPPLVATTDRPVAVVFYSGPTSWGRHDVFQMNADGADALAGRGYALDRSYDPHFLVYVLR
jgi:hypothetical protein